MRPARIHGNVIHFGKYAGGAVIGVPAVSRFFQNDPAHTRIVELSAYLFRRNDRLPRGHIRFFFITAGGVHSYAHKNHPCENRGERLSVFLSAEREGSGRRKQYDGIRCNDERGFAVVAARTDKADVGFRLVFADVHFAGLRLQSAGGLHGLVDGLTVIEYAAAFIRAQHVEIV